MEKVKIRASVLTSWLSALESEEYKQGRERLRDANDNFCCLGVLCDLASKDGVGEWCIPDDDKDYETYFLGPKSFHHTEIPPLEVLEWAGIPVEDGRYPELPEEGYVIDYLTTLNDGTATKRSRNFKEIAKVIRDNFEGV